jgi:ABC-type polar amino acid transport system ATPase subunit
MTMLIATHEMSFARDVAHEVAYLDQGVLVEKGTPAEIFTSPREESTKNFLSRVH